MIPCEQAARTDTFDRFSAFDAAGTSGLDSTGFLGAVFDGCAAEIGFAFPRSPECPFTRSQIT